MHADPTVAAKGVSDGTVVVAANRSINLFPMPARYFCSGHTFFIQQSARPEQCLNVHVTFTEGGVHGKLWRLQEAGLWHLHPRGYFDSGRYLTIRPPRIPTPYPPARLEPLEQCRERVAKRHAAPDPTYHGWWSPPGAASHCASETPQYDDANKNRGVTITEAINMAPRLQGHLKMAARYLVALRDGMSIAWLLNRTFVFPRFGCLCDRSEWPDIMPTCRLENSDLAFPFGCPLNFLLNVHFMQGIENGDGHHHGVPYREHSFLTNSRLSPSIRDSNVSVTFSSPRGGGGATGAGATGAGGAGAGGAGAGGVAEESSQPWVAGGGWRTYAAAVDLPKGATDVEILRALGPGSPHDSAAAIYLQDAEDVLGGLEDATAGEYIRALLDAKVLYGSWCCSRTNFHMPGATAFFDKPAKLPTGAAAKALRLARERTA